MSKFDDVVASMMTARDLQPTFRGMIYGDNGTGKSSLSGKTILKLLKPDEFMIFFDTSDGWTSLLNLPEFVGPDGRLIDRVKVVPFEAYEQLSFFAEHIRRKTPPFDKVGGIVLDELSKMSEQDVIRVHEAAMAGKYGEKEKERAEKQAVQEGRDYMIALNRFQKMYYNLFEVASKQSGVHVIATAHVNEKKDRDGVLIGIEPKFSPKVGSAAKDLVHVVGHLTSSVSKVPGSPEVASFKRTLQVHPNMRVNAKCRIGIKTTSIDADRLPDIVSEWTKNGIETSGDDITPTENNFILDNDN
jgi:KaiC/GvpD/RAD55 family RecA-like ATPase